MKSMSPQRAAIEHVMAMAHEGRVAEALAAADAALARHPGAFRLEAQRGRFLRLLGRLDDSRAYLETVVAGRPDSLEAAHELALTSRASGMADRALELVDGILARRPDHGEALLTRAGILSHERGDPEAALAALPHHGGVKVKVQRGRLLRVLGRHDDSRSCLETVAAAHPDSLEAAHELAVTLRATGEGERALDLVDSILTRRPSHRDALLMRAGLLAYERNDPEAALAAVEHGLTHHPAGIRFQVQRGRLLRALGQLDDSRAHLETVVAAHPDSLEAAHELAIAQRDAGDATGALETVDGILATAPAHLAARLMQVDLLVELAAQEKLVELLSSFTGALTAASDDKTRGTFAPAACKILLALPMSVSRPLLQQHQTLLAGSAGAVPPSLLWQTYRLADSLGLGSGYAAFAEALARAPRLQLAESRQLLLAIFRADARNTESLARSLIPRLPEKLQGEFELELLALFSGASGALEKRKGALHGPRRASEIRLIGRLLKETGRPFVAARYLGRAARVLPRNGEIFADHVMALIHAGQGERARFLLDQCDAAEDRLAQKPVVTLVRGYINLGDHETALRLCNTLDPTARRQKLGELHVNVLFAAGRNADALSEIEHLKNTAGRKFLHLGPTILGVSHLDASLEADANGAEAAGGTLSAARTVIRDWRRRRPELPPLDRHSGIPRQIVQYWDDAVPPPEIAGVVESWRAAPGFGHTLFNRKSAASFLAAKLGEDWAHALRMAGSPTEESDFFRLCYLMVEGGIYVDCDDWRVGDLDDLVRRSAGLTVFVEPFGTIANNVIIARPRHPAIIWAAVSAKRALLERHNDSTWARMGPGLMTRTIGRFISADAGPQDGAGDVLLLDQWRLGRHIQIHAPLPYKKGKKYWVRQNEAGGMGHLFCALAKAEDVLRRQGQPGTAAEAGGRGPAIPS